MPFLAPVSFISLKEVQRVIADAMELSQISHGGQPSSLSEHLEKDCRQDQIMGPLPNYIVMLKPGQVRLPKWTG